MHETGIIRSDMFGQMRQERDDVMFGDSLDFINARHVEFDIAGFPHGLCIFFRDHAEGGLGVAGVGLDLVPDTEFGGGFPNGSHFRARIARDHGRAPYAGGGQRILDGS